MVGSQTRIISPATNELKSGFLGWKKNGFKDDGCVMATVMDPALNVSCGIAPSPSSGATTGTGNRTPKSHREPSTYDIPITGLVSPKIETSIFIFFKNFGKVNVVC